VKRGGKGEVISPNPSLKKRGTVAPPFSKGGMGGIIDSETGNILPPLYLITDRHQTGGRSLLDVLRSALEGGVRMIQLREKNLSGRELFELATEIRELTEEYGARLLINDRVDIALAAGADGVHLPSNSFSPGEARRLLGDDAVIGFSAHSLDEALGAEADGADFVTFSPVYYTPSKAEYGEPQGLDRLEELCDQLVIPVYALGGIKENNISEAMIYSGICRHYA